MKILITGANGFLGCYLTDLLLKKGYIVIATGRGKTRLLFNNELFFYNALDFIDAKSVDKVIDEYKPEVVVHAGAMSKPDECELNKDLAYKTNVKGTVNLLKAAAKYQSHFIFISTDFIFDGDKGMYREEESANPVNYYGMTKAEAECEVKKYDYNWSIVRTVLVYGKPLTGRNNLLFVVKNKLENREVYKVVSDQVRTPTYIEDLVAGILAIIERKATGFYHLSGTDVLTPYEMACLTADFLKLDNGLLKKVTVKDFSEIAQRPLKTGLIINKAKKELDYHPISFKEGLKRTFS